MFSEITVTIEGNDYHVPAEGSALNLMLKDGTEIAISPTKIQIGGASGSVPTEPPALPSPTLIGTTMVTFKERALDIPHLSPPDSSDGRAFAQKVAQDYITACNETNPPAAALLSSVIDFFARYDAPNTTEAEKLLGTEAAALSNVSSSAQKALAFFDDSRTRAWDGFLSGARLYNMTDASSAGVGRARLAQSAKTYVQVAFAGLPGIDDLCQRVSWRMESFLNLARFLSGAQANQAALVPFLRKYRSQLMDTMPDGSAGLKSGGGALVYGSAAFDMVSRVQLSAKSVLFDSRGWDMSIRDLPLWYFRSMTGFLDKQQGTEVCIDEYTEDILDFAYVFDMDLIPGSSLQRALLVSGRVNWFGRIPNQKEKDEMGWDPQSFFDDATNNAYDILEDDHFRNTLVSHGTKHKREMQEIPLPPAWPHQRLLSAKSTDQQPLKDQPYRRDSALGNGITVFILDSGFSIEGANAAELRIDPSNLKENTYVVPNLIVLRGAAPKSKWVPEKLDDPVVGPGQTLRPGTMLNNQGHGTEVASVAIGTTYGIAARAEPFLIKMAGMYKKDDGRYAMEALSIRTVNDALRRVSHIVKKRHLQGKAVVNLSLNVNRNKCASVPGLWEEYQAVFQRYLNEFAQMGIPTVISAGNTGYKPPNAQGVAPPVMYMGDHLPAALGTSDNTLITVGSVHSSGRYYRGTTPEGAGSNPNGLTGSMTVVSFAKLSARPWTFR